MDAGGSGTTATTGSRSSTEGRAERGLRGEVSAGSVNHGSVFSMVVGYSGAPNRLGYSPLLSGQKQDHNGSHNMRLPASAGGKARKKDFSFFCTFA